MDSASTSASAVTAPAPLDDIDRRIVDALQRQGRMTFDELAGLPLVLPSDPHPLRARLVKLARDRGVALTCALEADSIRLQHQMVASGGGVAITAGTLDAPLARQLAVVRIARDPSPRQYCVRRY